MESLQDQADVTIWNAIGVGNYKQALKLVDKKMSKKPTDHYEALRIYIRSLSPSLSEQAAVLLHLEHLIQQKKPFVELSAIELFDESLRQVVSHSEIWAKLIGEIRWRFVKAAPKNEDNSLKCFSACLLNNDLDHARQIANSLEKSHPANRGYIFWNISSMLLFSTSSDYPESQTKLWGSLAFAQISKLAAATSQSTDESQLPARSIQTPQELLLLHLITKTYGKTEQQLEYLEDPKLGPGSYVSKGEWELWRMKLEMIKEAQRWGDLFSITGDLLKRARSKDGSGQLAEAHLGDWVVWEAYLDSAFEIEDPSYKSRVRAEVEAHLDPKSGIDKSWRRNASLAWVRLAFEDSAPFTEDVTPELTESTTTVPPKVQIIMKYLTDYGDASMAYGDLRPFAEKLDDEERTQILSPLSSPTTNLSSAKLITQAINKLKLKYLLTCSLPELERGRSVDASDEELPFQCISCGKRCRILCEYCLTAMARNTMQAYESALGEKEGITKHLLVTDRHPADDLCVLSATCLMKLGSMNDSTSTEPLITTSRTKYTLQATAMLEKAWLHSKPNPQINIMLIRLYTSLGCGSLAMRAYNRLGLKNIQLDTLSYVMFDRISTFHPKQFASHVGETTNEKDLEHQLKRQQKVYKDAYEQISENMWQSFKHGNYKSIFDIRTVKTELSHGLGAAMSVIESRRISRLVKPEVQLSPVSHGFNLLGAHLEQSDLIFTDNLDYKTFPNYESVNSTSVEELSRVAPAPSARRYRAHLYAEKLFLHLLPQTTSIDQDYHRNWLRQYHRTPAQNVLGTNKGKAEMTHPETLAYQAYEAMGYIVDEAGDREQWSDTDFHTRIEAYNTELCEAIKQMLLAVQETPALVPPFFNILHTLYTAYEAGKAALNFTDYVGRQSKKIYEGQAKFSASLTEVAKKLLQTVEKQCVLIRKGMDEGWIDKVLECALAEGTLLEEDNFMEEWAGEVVESWREAVSGLSYLKAT